MDEAEKKLRRLNELKILLAGEEWKNEKEKNKWTVEKEALEEEKNSLMKSKKKWEDQVEDWGKALRGFGGGRGSTFFAVILNFNIYFFIIIFPFINGLA